MTGLRAIYHRNINNDIKSYKKMLYLYGLTFVIEALFLIYAVYKGMDSGTIMVILLFFLVTVIILNSVIYNYKNLINYLTEDKIRQKQEELKHIEQSIDLFYLPLHDLLASYDENVISRIKTRRIAEINGHKHLAEPEVRSIFEKYIQTHDGSKSGSKKLLDLVSQDIEFLQKRFIELNMELKVE
ncbi:hypothetical protein [Methanosarcina sp. UBA289]|uniref:hypothetical protein n=1 Tax=Methanosarcina sp. UBA289 TaxID=1915574 RepID=UPI0025FC678E|nr:hypothetical protein [Methanosarcina sp. UBA289]